MGYKMKGSPHKMGTIQGSSGHASALKQNEKTVSEFERGQEYANILRDLKDLGKQIKEDARESKVSEKTKRLRKETKLQDFKTEQYEKRHEKAMGEEGKYGKGLFGGKLRRKKAKRQFEKSGKKEDKVRRKLEKSEHYDSLSPTEKTAHDRERQAFLTAKFSDDAATMHNIARTGFNLAKRAKITTEPTTEKSKTVQPKTSIGDMWKSGFDVGKIGKLYNPIQTFKQSKLDQSEKLLSKSKKTKK